MDQSVNRLLMELERTMREVNRETINPVIRELTIDDLRPVLLQVARARARYLKALFDLGGETGTAEVSDHQFQELAGLRHAYDELVSGAKALEVAIQRGYLDVQPSKR